jgi:hypothetical protein
MSAGDDDEGGGAFYVDIAALRQGVTGFDQMGVSAAAALEWIEWLIQLSEQAFGEKDDVIGAPAKASIGPGQQQAREVVFGVKELGDGHAIQIKDVTQVATDTNTGTRGAAGGGRH